MSVYGLPIEIDTIEKIELGGRSYVRAGGGRPGSGQCAQGACSHSPLCPTRWWLPLCACNIGMIVVLANISRFGQLITSPTWENSNKSAVVNDYHGQTKQCVVVEDGRPSSVVQVLLFNHNKVHKSIDNLPGAPPDDWNTPTLSSTGSESLALGIFSGGARASRSKSTPTCVCNFTWPVLAFYMPRRTRSPRTQSPRTKFTGTNPGILVARHRPLLFRCCTFLFVRTRFFRSWIHAYYYKSTIRAIKAEIDRALPNQIHRELKSRTQPTANQTHREPRSPVYNIEQHTHASVISERLMIDI